MMHTEPKGNERGPDIALLYCESSYKDNIENRFNSFWMQAILTPSMDPKCKRGKFCLQIPGMRPDNIVDIWLPFIQEKFTEVQGNLGESGQLPKIGMKKEGNSVFFPFKDMHC